MSQLNWEFLLVMDGDLRESITFEQLNGDIDLIKYGFSKDNYRFFHQN